MINKPASDKYELCKLFKWCGVVCMFHRFFKVGVHKTPETPSPPIESIYIVPPYNTKKHKSWFFVGFDIQLTKLLDEVMRSLKPGLLSPTGMVG